MIDIPKDRKSHTKTVWVRLFPVLAILVVAFAILVAFVPAEDNDAVIVYDNGNIIPIPKVIDESVEQLVPGDLFFYVAEDATVKVEDQSRNFTIYVENGKVLELNFKTEPAPGKAVTIVTVAGDPAFQQAGQSSAFFDGKQEFNSTKFKFEAVKGMSLCYEAAKTRYDVKYDGTKFTHTDSLGSGKVIISVDKEFKKNPEIADGASSSAIHIANGQSLIVESITPQDILGLNYGIEVTNISQSTYTYTYYPKGYDAGTIELEGSDKVKLKDGTVTVKTSEASIKASKVTADSMTFEIGETGELSLTGSIRTGSMSFTGLIDLKTSPFKVNSGTTVTIENKATFFQDTTMEVNGTLIVKTGLIGHTSSGEKDLTVIGGKTGSLILENEKLWSNDPSTGIVIKLEKGTDKFFGSVDTSAISEIARVKGGIATSNIGLDQTFQVIDDAYVSQLLTVDGILIINQGVTLTIEDNAAFRQTGKLSSVVNNGTIIVKAGTDSGSGLFVDQGKFVNNGTIQFSAKSYAQRGNAPTFGVYGDAKGFENRGTITISRNDNISLSSAFSNSGTMTLSGKVVEASTFDNGGKLILNGTEVRANLNPMMKGGSVQIQSVKIFAGKELKMKVGLNNGITLKGSPDGTILTVRNVTFSGSGSVDMQGDINFSIDDGSTGTLMLRIEGSSTVRGQFSTPKDMIMAFGDISAQTKASLSVAGSLTINKDTQVDGVNNGSRLSMTVTGRVVDYNSVLTGCNYTAALYVTESSTVYTNFETAISEASAAGISLVETGNTIIVKDLTIPAGMTVQGKTDNVTITIGSSSSHPVVTIGVAGALNVNRIIIKNGTLFAENSYDIDEQSIEAHVKIESGDSVRYQSLNVALDEAQRGDCIELIDYYVLKDSRMTIPEGITVDATANDGKTFAVIGSNLTINGTLIVSDFYFIAENDDGVSITVNGYLKDEGVNQTEDKWYTPVGISYYESTVDPRGEEVTYFVITSVDNIDQAISSADEKKVSVEGKVELGDLIVEGTEYEPVTVTFKKDIDASSISLTNASVIALPGKSIDAVFANDRGSITIKGAYADRKEVSIFSLGENGVFMSGRITDSIDGSYTIQFNGLTGTDNATIGWGNYDSQYPSIEFLGDTIVTGKRNHIENTVDEPTSNNAGVVTIAGSLVADHASKITIVSDIDVLGTLAAKDKDGSLSAGSVEVEGNIFLGVMKDDIFSEQALLKHYGSPVGAYAHYGKGYTPALGAVSILSGKISVMDGRYITTVPGHTIDDQIIEDMGLLEIDLEGITWIKIYGVGTYNMDGLTPPIKDCAVSKISDESGKSVAKYDDKNRVIYDSSALDLTREDHVHISLDYRIYTVMIKTDASIKAVYIDDILAYTGSHENKFYLRNVAAGSHTVSVEPVSGYDAKNVYLYEEDGTILPGMEFTFDEDYCVNVEGYGETAIYNIAGTEVDPVPVPDPEKKTEWTITTILLCVLVLIIAIMAVVIVLRLNRS